MDSYSKFQSLFPLLNQYRVLLLPLLPLVLFFILITYLFIQPKPITQQSQQIEQKPTSAISIPPLTPLPSSMWSSEAEWEENPEKLPGFEKKEERTDGTIVYIYTSQKTDRPNITIRNATNEVLFYREQGTTSLPLMKIPLIKETYGEPDQIIKGSTYYGSQAEIYFYRSIHTAYVVNPNTTETYEVHFFPPMSADEYLQRYKDLN